MLILRTLLLGPRMDTKSPSTFNALPRMSCRSSTALFTQPSTGWSARVGWYRSERRRRTATASSNTTGWRQPARSSLPVRSPSGSRSRARSRGWCGRLRRA